MKGQWGGGESVAKESAMWVRSRIYRFLALTACSGILLSIQCPPLVMSSVKTGMLYWISGSGVGGVSLAQLGDLILTGFFGGNNAT